jgi:hypothetical protein
MQDIHDPFSFLLTEIHAHDAGRRDWLPADRELGLRVLLVEEAQEIAWGLRHLSVVHGPIVDDVDGEMLDDLVCALLDLVDSGWYRFGGIPDHHFTLTVGGPHADDLVADAIEAIVAIRPPNWRILDTAVLEVSR